MYVIDNIKDYFLKNFKKIHVCIFVEIQETSRMLGYFYYIKTYWLFNHILLIEIKFWACVSR